MVGKHGKFEFRYSPAMCTENSGRYMVQVRTAHASGCSGEPGGGSDQGGPAGRTGSQARL
jgi:hypothetical protein